MTILSDVDGVLLDWCGGFKQWILKKGIPLKHAGEPMDWNLDLWIDHPNVLGLIAEYNSSENFEHVPAFDDAQAVIPRLKYLGADLTAITSCSDDPKSIQMRERNLEAVFGKVFGDIICLPLRTPKVDALRKFNPGCWWIEDKPEGAQEGIHTGHKSILITRAYNKAFDAEANGVHRASDWYEIYGRIVAG